MPFPVLLFASLRSRFGNQISIDVELPTTIANLKQALTDRGFWTPGARIALNQRFADESNTVTSGDEVAVIPPVSGG